MMLTDLHQMWHNNMFNELDKHTAVYFAYERRTITSVKTNDDFTLAFDYLKEFYDVLHTTGHRYIINDIHAYLKARGVSF